MHHHSLQIALAVAGALLLLALLAFNAWQARDKRPRRAPAQRPAASPPEGAAAENAAAPAPPARAWWQRKAPQRPAPAPRMEPALDDADLPEDSAATAHALQYAADAAPDAPQDGAPDWAPHALPSANSLAADKHPALSPLLDAIAPIIFDPGELVSGEAALAAWPATRRAGSKPFALEGRNIATSQWEHPHSGQWYEQFQAGVQLANRAGALNEIEFSEFTLKVQAFAEAINATPHFPDMLHEVARARELDHFASTHDARLGFVLRAQAAAWSTGYLQQAAARHGFVAGLLPGRMVLPSPHAGCPPTLSLEFDTQAAMADDMEHAAVYEMFLGLEVTRVQAAEEPFARMHGIAQALAEEMDAALVDAHGYRILPDAFKRIHTDVQQLYLTLQEHGFAAGGALAQRLFA